MRKSRSFSVLSYLFHVFAVNEKMSIQQLAEMFKIEQKQIMSNEEAAILVSQFSNGRNCLDEIEFQTLMMSRENRA
jgi:hypothetical protein